MIRRSLFIAFTFLSVHSFAQNDSTTIADTTVTATAATDAITTDTVSLLSTESLAAINPGPVPQTSDEVYRLKARIDVPLTAALAAWSIYGFSQIYSKESSTQQQINNLRVSDINSFDRWAADLYSEKAANLSDMFFYGSMPLPAFLLLDKKIRKDAGKIAFLYLEAMSVTGLFYTGSNHIFNRYRPLAYNPNAPMGERLEGGAKNSFIAGHMALVGTSTFFMAKVYSDYHPESKWRWALFTLAGVATGTTGYLRHRAGKHFPSDVLVGTALGTLSGILIPHFHKNKLIKNPNVRISPFVGPSNGLAFTYTFK